MNKYLKLAHLCGIVLLIMVSSLSNAQGRSLQRSAAGSVSGLAATCSLLSPSLIALSGRAHNVIAKTISSTLNDSAMARNLNLASNSVTLVQYNNKSTTAGFRFDLQNDCSFTITSEGTLQCLDASVGTSTVPTFATCLPNSPAQSFTLKQAADSSTMSKVSIQSLITSKCLDMQNKLVTIKTKAVWAACDDTETQNYYLTQGTVLGDGTPGTFQALSYTGSNGVRFVYRLLMPDNYDSSISYPLVVWFHGKNSDGTNNTSNLANGVTEYNSAYNRGRYPALVLVPQQSNRNEVSWMGAGQYPQILDVTPSQAALMELINGTITQYNLDQNRLYLTGISAGGSSSYMFAYHTPNMFAAIVEFSGSGFSEQAPNLAQSGIDIWAIHGQDDATASDMAVIQAIRDNGGNPKYTNIPASATGGTHCCWDILMTSPGVIDRLFAQSKH